jgi:FtsH-binding integral membrane protein
MDDFSTTGYAPSDARARSEVSTLLGQVMFLVAVALGFMTAGAIIGQNLSQGTGFILFLVAFGMLLAQAFAGERLRVGTFAICWLYAIALLLGLGIGPTIGYFLHTDQGSVVLQAAGCTALVTLGMGAAGFAMSKDLVAWMRPLSFVILGLVVVSFAMLIFSSGGNPIISAGIGIVSALLIMVDFNYLRKHGTKDDAVWLATGIFVSIVNIFLSLLNLFDN